MPFWLCLLLAVFIDLGLSWTLGFWPFNSHDDEDDGDPPDFREKHA